MTAQVGRSQPLTLSAAEAISAAGTPDGVSQLLRASGALLLPGAGVRCAQDLADLAGALGLTAVPQLEPFVPRRELGAGVWSEPAWPNTSPMCMHHELGWQRDPPPYFVVACLRAATSGGRTAVADGHELLAALPSRVVDPAARFGWTLVRRYPTAGLIGMTWQQAFPGMNVAAVERYAAQESVMLEWGPDGLSTTRTRPAVRPVGPDGEPAWSNLLAFLSEWTLDPAVRAYLLGTLGPRALPFETCLGDGMPFTAADVETVNAAYDSLSTAITWQDGDVLVLDNLRTAHSCEPFTGPRSMAVMHAQGSWPGGLSHLSSRRPGVMPRDTDGAR